MLKKHKKEVDQANTNYLTKRQNKNKQRYKYENIYCKTVEDAVNKACLDLGVTVDQLNYEVTLETKGLFSKKAEISCWTVEMVQEYIESFIRKILTDMEFEVETISYVQDGRIYCNINTSNNSILIGKAGVILRAINLIVKNAVSTTFKKTFRSKC